MRRPRALSILAALLGLGISGAHAAENGHGIYLLGSRGPMAGFTPAAPGLYFENDLYIYDAGVSLRKELPFGFAVGAGVQADAVVDLPRFTYMTPIEIVGGRLGFLLTVPVGWEETKAHAELFRPNGPLFPNHPLGQGAGRRFSITEDVATVGDPQAQAFLGWKAGNFHWSAGVLVNVPIGDYHEGSLANIAFHYWAADLNAALTWFDPKIGLDLSATAGFTFSAENEDTDYETGDEFHIEFAAVQHFGKRLFAGVVGYHYQQLTGDTGSGARLGPYEGRTTGIGPVVGLNFNLGMLPVQTQFRYYHEFDVENRLEGDAYFVTASMPLWVPHQ